MMPQREGVGLAIKRYRGFYSLYRGATTCNDSGKVDHFPLPLSQSSIKYNVHVFDLS